MPDLYVSDLDGTLLRGDATLSEFSRSALNELLDDGLAFTVATARSIASIRPILSGLRLRLPVIEFNGAFLTDLESGRHIQTNAIEPSLLDEIQALIRDAGCLPFVSTFDGREDRLYHQDILNAGMRHYLDDRVAARDPRLRHTGDLRDAFGEQVVCLTVVDRPGKTTALEAALAERFGDGIERHHFENIYCPGWFWLTIHDRRASKDLAIRWLMERHGLEDADLIVFGDRDNDVPMFRAATRAVAVANAIDEVKAHATEVIGTNDTDSVARYILEHARSQETPACARHLKTETI